MSRIVVANWKLHPSNLKRAESIARAEDYKNVVICPPFIYLPALKKVLKKAKLGAQDAFWANEGAYTGEISPAQIKDLRVSYVIIGHSERRYILQEGDDFINQKVEASLRAGLRVILCVGENLATHRQGYRQSEIFIKNQLRKNLKNIKAGHLKNLLIAYEPVWAISTSGTGLKDTPAESEKIIVGLKSFLQKEYRLSDPKVLYGGSVNSNNVADYLSGNTIDGVLVGGASLHPKEFNKIIKTCS